MAHDALTQGSPPPAAPLKGGPVVHPPPPPSKGGPWLEELEEESIYILREVVAQFERPVLLFSGGKDSIVLSWLARKAFWPGQVPFPLLHVDTGHNFPETLEFRDRFVAQFQLELLTAHVEESLRRRGLVEDEGPRPSRNAAQSATLLEALAEHGFDACIGGARRDEEKARAKERVFSHRNTFGAWEPRTQRPELWNLYNGRYRKGEHFRIFPLSNWTELDVWLYLEREEIPLPSLYFAHRRPIVESRGILLAHCPWVEPLPGERLESLQVRFRTIGDMTCTGAVLSSAANLAQVIAEIQASPMSERGGRGDDRLSEAAMEERKRQGYF